MFIQTEATPNPATLKFLPGKPVLPGSTRDYRNADEAVESPLAKRLFDISHVSGVFLGHDFVTVTRSGRRMAAAQARHSRRDHGPIHVRHSDVG